MLTFKKLGSHGNLGNQLFQVASIIGLAKKYQVDYVFPSWKYASFFKQQIPQSKDPAADTLLKEVDYHYSYEFFDQHAEAIKTKKVDVHGWLQTEKYWKDNVADIRETFAFTDELKKRIMEKIGQSPFLKPTIAISIRRGDYVGNSNYELLPITYYLLALLKYFPDHENYNVILFSDDMPYCKTHFECLPHAIFAQGFNDIEQLCLMSHCDHFIIANSTFSWWGAYLAEKEGTKVIRPAHIFAGELLKKSNIKDHFPDRWICFDHKNEQGRLLKLDLTDVTFTIPVSYDHTDRKGNLDLCVCLLQRFFNTNVVIGEQGGDKFKYMSQWCQYRPFKELETFHRTKMLNDMAKEAETTCIINWDADVFVPPLQVWQAVEKIRKGEADMVYPYDGRFARVPRTWFPNLERLLDVGIFGFQKFNGLDPGDQPSVGGAIAYRKEAFFEAGLENEHFVSYGPEDHERFHRFTALGYKVDRETGKLFHMDHYVGKDSSTAHQHFRSNEAELEKIRAMDPHQLREYISTWPWFSFYSPTFYLEISETAEISRDEIFTALFDLYRIRKKSKLPITVLDIGCGIGEWGRNIEKFNCLYKGVDFKIPQDRLLIPLENYLEHDMRTSLELEEKPDMLLCLEVAEHIEAEFAGSFVKNLCDLVNPEGVIVFSAAIPHQGGVNHVNEQWQSYWQKLFAENGFFADISLRNIIHQNADIDIWYRQNIIIYRTKPADLGPIDFVHPKMYLNIVNHYK